MVVGPMWVQPPRPLGVQQASEWTAWISPQPVSVLVGLCARGFYSLCTFVPHLRIPFSDSCICNQLSSCFSKSISIHRISSGLLDPQHHNSHFIPPRSICHAKPLPSLSIFIRFEFHVVHTFPLKTGLCMN
jgi:hypothetical protein